MTRVKQVEPIENPKIVSQGGIQPHRSSSSNSSSLHRLLMDAKQWRQARKGGIALYKSPPSVFWKFAYVAAGAQLFLWTNLAELSYFQLRDSEQDPVDLAPWSRRALYAGCCMGLGIGIASSIHLMATRTVRSLKLHNRQVTLETHGLLQRARTLPVESLSSPSRLIQVPATGRVTLRSKGALVGYTLDKAWIACEPSLFDGLFYKRHSS